MPDEESIERAIYALAHDLQEPLRAIETCTEMIQRRRAAILDGESAELFDAIVGGAHRMRRLIHDTLDLAKTSQEPAERSQVDTCTIVQLALKDLPIANSGVTVEVGSLPVVYANSDQLLRVFENLLANAIKYKSLSPPHIEISAHLVNSEWVFAIRDNGIGIAPEHHAFIFERFTRLHSNATHNGSGLGLAICKQIVERYQGRMWVESQEGDGATFYFTLPCAGQPAMSGGN